ncbi:MAG: Bifunctional homocysteine S-methyltransferase/5,10-methylenetetrahydrofolate reductase [Candidatus Heimdallarchaeota archaeon LC_3]|nr:MAG: Bifunctional homocysteine S-methyltransferase/5,10-methylenetetrahydrofolate reductase [Candidatus Heimdallarchaeota archaeon LC_3]
MILLHFKKLLESNKVVLFDGAMGTEIFKQGLNPGKVPDLLNIKNPEHVQNILANYYNHSDLVQTCTFSSNTLCLTKNNIADQLEQINIKALENIKKVCPENKLIVGDIGPSGEFRPPVGKINPEQWKESFLDQVKVLESGIDVWHVETISDIQEMEAAIKAIKEISQKPIMASMTYRKTKKGFFTIMGDSPSSCVGILEDQKVDVIGTNCTIGSDEMVELSAELTSLTNKPVLVKPNAGSPRLEYSTGQTLYDQKPGDFVSDISKMIDNGVKIVGGCCGTTAKHVELLRSKIDTL